MTLVYIALAIVLSLCLFAAGFVLGRGSQRWPPPSDMIFHGDASPSVWRGPDTLNPTHVLVFHQKWWPQTLMTEERDFLVKTNDVQKVIKEPVAFSLWSGRPGRGGWSDDWCQALYDLDFASGKVVHGGDEGEDNRFDKLNPSTLYWIEEVKWSATAKPHHVDGDVWNMTLEIHGRIEPYPWEREKGDPFYLPSSSRNLILEKHTDPDKIAAAFEANMAEVYAEASKG